MGSFFGMPEPSPEQRREMEEAQERAALEAHIAYQETLDYLHGLSKEDLAIVHRIFSNAAEGGPPKAYAHVLQWSAHTNAILAFKYKVCHCGEDHTEDALQKILNDAASCPASVFVESDKTLYRCTIVGPHTTHEVTVHGNTTRWVDGIEGDKPEPEPESGREEACDATTFHGGKEYECVIFGPHDKHAAEAHGAVIEWYDDE